MHDRLDPDPTRATFAARLLVPVLLVFLAACSDAEQRPPSGAQLAPAVPGSAQQVEAEVGAASFIAVAIQTSQIPATVAAEHGIERRDDLVMVRVSPRQGEPGSIGTAPAAVRVAVTDLRGQTSVLELDRKVIAGLVDHVGTMQVTLPATLRFEVIVTTPEGETRTMKFSREFRAR